MSVERERCAKVCRKIAEERDGFTPGDAYYDWQEAALKCEAAIRRGE